MDQITVYVSIGNSDDKLTQAQWAAFYRGVTGAIGQYADQVHGQWVSEPSSAWQNACWCFETRTGPARELQSALRDLAARYGQDSIAWAPVAETLFLAAKYRTVKPGYLSAQVAGPGFSPGGAAPAESHSG